MGFPDGFWDRYKDRLVQRKGSETCFILPVETEGELFLLIDSFIAGTVRLMTITGYPDKEGRLYLEYHFTDGLRCVSLKYQVPDDKKLKSLTPKLPAAGWAEREIMDLFDIVFEGHPNPARLLIPDDMPRGVYLRT